MLLTVSFTGLSLYNQARKLVLFQYEDSASQSPSAHIYHGSYLQSRILHHGICVSDHLCRKKGYLCHLYFKIVTRWNKIVSFGGVWHVLSTTARGVQTIRRPFDYEAFRQSPLKLFLNISDYMKFDIFICQINNIIFYVTYVHHSGFRFLNLWLGVSQEWHDPLNIRWHNKIC